MVYIAAAFVIMLLMVPAWNNGNNVTSTQLLLNISPNSLSHPDRRTTE